MQIIVIDLILHKPRAYRHTFYNMLSRDTRYSEVYLNNIFFCSLCIIFELFWNMYVFLKLEGFSFSGFALEIITRFLDFGCLYPSDCVIIVISSLLQVLYQQKIKRTYELIIKISLFDLYFSMLFFLLNGCSIQAFSS